MKFEYFVLVVEPTEETHQISLVSSIFLLTFPFCEVKTQNVVCTEAILYKENQVFLFWKVNITKIQLFFRNVMSVFLTKFSLFVHLMYVCNV